MLELYEYHRSSASFRVRILCNFKGLSYESHHVHLLNQGGEQKQAAYTQLNPMGQVPLLVDGELSLSQSVAIVEYLEEKHPEPPLFPKEPNLKAQVREIVEIVNSGIHPIQNLAVMTQLGEQFGLDREAKWAWAKLWIEKGFGPLETKLKKSSNEFCFGNQLTMADLFVIPQIYNARRFGVDMDHYPTLKRIWENGLKQPAIEKALPDNHPHFEK